MAMRWEGDDTIRRGFDLYEVKVKQAVRQVAQYWQGVFETYARENAPWTDRTGNARQSLHAYVEDLAGDTVRLYLSHGPNIKYGIYLETRFSGKYAIIWPTIERHLPEIRQMLQQIFGR